MELCPHCGNAASIEPHSRLRYRCRICGGPRVRLDDPQVPRTGDEVPQLQLAQRMRARRAAWSVGAGAFASFGLLAALITLLIVVLAGTGTIVSLALLAGTLVPWVAAAFAARKAKQATISLKENLEAAWLAVATMAYRAHQGQLDARQLATSMGIGETEAEHLLAEADVNAFLEREPGPRLRVGETEAEPDWGQPAVEPQKQTRN